METVPIPTALALRQHPQSRIRTEGSSIRSSRSQSQPKDMARKEYVTLLNRNGLSNTKLQTTQDTAAPQPGHSAAAAPIPQSSAILSNQDFLSRVEAAKADIRSLTTQINNIATAHQRTLSSTDSSASAALEALIAQTQVLNTSIKDQIKYLETDAARSGNANSIKNSQVGQLKTSFRKQLEEYRAEEAQYEKRYREQIARQYRIVNPDATQAEVDEAAQADWGNEGVFQTAVRPFFIAALISD